MESQNYYLEEGFPFQGRKLEKMKAFLWENGLTYDEHIQYSILLFTAAGQLAGCGSRHENVLKCIAVSPSLQGEGLLQSIVTQLLKNACEKGFSHLFLFTKPEKLPIFSDMGFYSVTETEKMLLMENRKNGLQEYLKKESQNCSSPAGAIVMNANPFTLGHLHLVKTAAAACGLLHVFVLSEDSSAFPASVRLRLVQEGCRDLTNVYVHGSSDYLISHATFPDYFLKDKAGAGEEAALLDLKIFGTYFKEAFHLTRRFVGEEPFSPITELYNRQMKKILPAYGLEVTEIPRYRAGNAVVSATLVRKKFLEGDFQSIKELVPLSTYEYLLSEEGRLLREKLRNTGETGYGA